jgi:hypothetical protein
MASDVEVTVAGRPDLDAETADDVRGAASTGVALGLPAADPGVAFAGGGVEWDPGGSAAMLVVGRWLKTADAGGDGSLAWDAVPARGFARIARESWAVVAGSFALRSMDGLLWAGPPAGSADVAGDRWAAVDLDPVRLSLSRGAAGVAVRLGEREEAWGRAWCGMRALPDAGDGAPVVPPWSTSAVARVLAAGADASFPAGEHWRVQAGAVVTAAFGEVGRASYAERLALAGDGATRGLLGVAAGGRMDDWSARAAALVQVRSGGVSPGLVASATWQALPWLATGPSAFVYGDGLVTTWGRLEDPTVTTRERVGGRAGAAWIASARVKGRLRADVVAGATRTGDGWRLAGRAEAHAEFDAGWWVEARAFMTGSLPFDESPDADAVTLSSGASVAAGKRWGDDGDVSVQGGWVRWPAGIDAGRAGALGGIAIGRAVRARLSATALIGPQPGLPAGTAGRVVASVAVRPVEGLVLEAGWRGRIATVDGGGATLEHAACLTVAWESVDRRPAGSGGERWN